MTTTTHTPTPWNIESIGTDIVATYMNDGQQRRLATATNYANAAFLAKRLKAHDELVAALQRILSESNQRMAKGGDKQDFQDVNRHAGDIARAALAKVAQ